MLREPKACRWYTRGQPRQALSVSHPLFARLRKLGVNETVCATPSNCNQGARDGRVGSKAKVGSLDGAFARASNAIDAVVTRRDGNVYFRRSKATPMCAA